MVTPHKLSEDDTKEMFIEVAAIGKDAFTEQLMVLRDLPKNISGLERSMVRQQRSRTTWETSVGVRKLPTCEIRIVGGTFF